MGMHIQTGLDIHIWPLSLADPAMHDWLVGVRRQVRHQRSQGLGGRRLPPRPGEISTPHNHHRTGMFCMGSSTGGYCRGVDIGTRTIITVCLVCCEFVINVGGCVCVCDVDNAVAGCVGHRGGCARPPTRSCCCDVCTFLYRTRTAVWQALQCTVRSRF